MIIKRLLIAQAVILLGLGAVFFLPVHSGLGPAGIALKLPEEVGEWKTKGDPPVTPEELKGLAPDTEFARRRYYNAAGDEIYVSIVLSGADMANSIHRPERCLQAQGWTVEKSDQIPVPQPGGKPLVVTRLTDERDLRPKDSPKAIAWRHLNYYWFIGSQDITCSHWTRTAIDVKDRLLHGQNQRWAYVTVAANVTDNLRPEGRKGLTKDETARLAEDFIAQIVPLFKKPQA